MADTLCISPVCLRLEDTPVRCALRKDRPGSEPCRGPAVAFSDQHPTVSFHVHITPGSVEQSTVFTTGQFKRQLITRLFGS